MPVTDYKLIYERDYLPGQIIKLVDSRIYSYRNAESSIFYFGLGVCMGAGTDDVVFPVDANSKFLGICVYQDTYESRAGWSHDETLDLYGYPSDRLVSVARDGVLAVLVDSDVSRGAPVFCRHTATPGSTGIKGCFRKDADTATAFAVPNAFFTGAVAAPAAGSMAIAAIDLVIPAVGVG